MQVRDIVIKPFQFLNAIVQIDGTLVSVYMANGEYDFYIQDRTEIQNSALRIHLRHKGLFQVLIERFYAHIIVGGSQRFFHLSTAVGRIDWDPITRVFSLSEMQSIIVDAKDQRFTFELEKKRDQDAMV